MKTIPAVFRRRLALQAHYQKTRYDWLVVDTVSDLRKLRSDVAELQGFRTATRGNVEVLGQHLVDMLSMLDDAGLNDRFTFDRQAPAAH